MSRTRFLGLPLLKENDTGNYASINEALSRLDVLSTLALESTTITQEPVVTSADIGKAWAVEAATATGTFWGTISEDSILIWTYAGDVNPSPNPITGEPFPGDVRWYAVPIWDGAYAYVKDSADFNTYEGGTWFRPSKRKITNFTLNKDQIAEYVQSGNDKWYTAVTVNTPHRLVEVHCYITYDTDAIQADSAFDPEDFFGVVLGQEQPGGQPELPYILPKIALENQRPATAFTPTNIVLESKPALGVQSENGKWTIPGSVSTGNGDNVFFNTTGPDAFSMAASSRGLISKLDQENLPSFVQGAGGQAFLLIDLSDTYQGDAGASYLTYFHSITFQITYLGG